jgi:hypothetical protein
MITAKLLKKLTEITGEDTYMTKTIANVTAVNYIKVHSNNTTSKAVTQTNRVLQGNPLSPLIFSTATIITLMALKHQEGSGFLHMYMDEMVITGRHTDDLQKV